MACDLLDERGFAPWREQPIAIDPKVLRPLPGHCHAPPMSLTGVNYAIEI
jgi:hypothetical protein